MKTQSLRLDKSTTCKKCKLPIRTVLQLLRDYTVRTVNKKGKVEEITYNKGTKLCPICKRPYQ